MFKYKYIKTADEIVRNLWIYKVPQSIVITGLTGSGKTETTKHLLKFFCGLTSSEFAEHILNANFLLETFGNSSTIENANSSRFMKIVEVLLKFEINIKCAHW